MRGRLPSNCCYLIIFFISLAVCMPRAAESPTRFRAAKQWEAEVTLRATSAGSTELAEWGVNRSVSFKLTLSIEGELTPPVLSWNGEGEAPPNAFAVNDHASVRTDPSSEPLSFSMNGAISSPFAGPTNTGGYLQINETNATYSVQFGAGYATLVTMSGITVTQLCGIPGVLPLLKQFPLPDSGLVLSNTYTYPIDQYCDVGNFSCDDCVLGFVAATQPPTLPGSVQVTWNLQPKLSDPELAVDIEGYPSWLPEADLKNKAGAYEGKPLKITARLVDENGVDVDIQAEKFDFKLSNVSTEKGVCLNFPPDGQGDTKADLRFNQARNPTLSILDNGATAETKTPNLSKATAKLSPYDFGAYGDLKVTAVVNGKTIEGYLAIDPAKPKTILLPKRTEPSKIADAWKDQFQVRSLPDEDDSDADPVGDEHPGDGFSLYEEYRGFAENGKHIRTNPDVKDLFVRDLINAADVKAEIKKFRRLSELDVHFQLLKGEMAGDARMNFNNGHAYLHNQHGIYLKGRSSDQESSSSVTRPGFDPNVLSTPATYSGIELQITGIGIDLQSGPSASIFRTYKLESVAHELGHVCSVYHHGDKDPPHLILGKVEMTDGSWGLIKPIDESIVKVWPENSAIPPLVFEPFGAKEIVKLWVGAPHGQHSGNMDCIMRYHSAELYPANVDPEHVFYRFEPSDQHSRTIFCDSPEGTKANKTGRSPQPRFGDADPDHKRGDCKHQFCVNDKYANDPKHNRKDPRN